MSFEYEIPCLGAYKELKRVSNGIGHLGAEQNYQRTEPQEKETNISTMNNI